MPDRIARKYIVRGTVQGVGFRYFVHRAARELGVQGTVRNLDDGSVEVIATGTAKQLADLAGRLHTGPASSTVRGVTEQEAPLRDYGGFQIA